jgi:hypothetical protein
MARPPLLPTVRPPPIPRRRDDLRIGELESGAATSTRRPLRRRARERLDVWCDDLSEGSSGGAKASAMGAAAQQTRRVGLGPVHVLQAAMLSGTTRHG